MKRTVWLVVLGVAAPALIFAQSENIIQAMKDRVWRHVAEVVASLPVREITPHKFEEIPAGEDEDALAVTRMMFELQMGSFLRRLAADPLAVAHRDAHAKGHGCVKAVFQVDENLPESLQTEVFKPRANYQAVIRYSNGSGQVAADAQPDGRGMAIKLIDALASPSLLGDSPDQDFMLINSGRFFIKNVKDYRKFQAAIIAGLQAGQSNPAEMLAPFILERLVRQSVAEDLDDETVAALSKIIAENQDSPKDLAVAVHQSGRLNLVQQGFLLKGLLGLSKNRAPVELQALTEIQRQPARNPLDYAQYGSLAPYLWKSPVGGEFAVKYKTSPVNCRSGEKIVSQQTLPASQTMKQALFERLQNQQVCYDFEVEMLNPRFAADKKKEIVEDATVDWNGRSGIFKISKTYHVARLTLEKPTFIEDLDTDCEGLSYNPWRAHADHRPLGGINRVRRFAVTGSFARRSLINSEKEAE